MWGLSASEALARLVHSCSGGLAWGCFRARDKRQSAFRGHQVTQAKTDGRASPGLIQSSRFKREWGVQAAGVGDVHVAGEACLYNLPAPGGATVHRARNPRVCILPLGAELVCLPYQTGSYSKPGLGLTGLWVQWGLQCSGGTGGPKRGIW